VPIARGFMKRKSSDSAEDFVFFRPSEFVDDLEEKGYIEMRPCDILSISHYDQLGEMRYVKTPDGNKGLGRGSI
jgi:hypothetical protein